MSAVRRKNTSPQREHTPAQAIKSECSCRKKHDRSFFAILRGSTGNTLRQSPHGGVLQRVNSDGKETHYGYYYWNKSALGRRVQRNVAGGDWLMRLNAAAPLLLFNQCILLN